MCGRFTLRTPIEEVADLFDLLPGDMAEVLAERPRYNIAPTQDILAVRHRPDSPGASCCACAGDSCRRGPTRPAEAAC